MINYVIINGVNSNTKNGLGINELPPITKPSMRTQTEEIDGRDGDIITKLGYSAYDKTITIGLFGTGYDVNDIISFFTSEGTITFSNEPDKYYKFTMLEQIDVESLLRFKTASITFHCQPFKYPTSETPLEIEYDYIEQTGEVLTLNNTGESILKLDLKGNTSQDTTTGKNLLSYPYPQPSSTINGVTFTMLEDGSVKVNGTSTNTCNYALMNNNANFPNGTYIISLKNGISGDLYIFYGDLDSGLPGKTAITDRIETLTNNTFGYFIIQIPKNRTINNRIVKPMIRLSTITDNTWEPYTNGASPNPDYPQPINVVSGDNEVVVCGKNLLSSSFEQASANTIGCNIDNFPSGTYTFSTQVATAPHEIQVKVKNGGSYERLIAQSNSKTITFTLDTTKDIRIEMWKSNGNPLSDYSNFMLNEDNEATPYEPYQSQTYPINLPVENLFDKDNANTIDCLVNGSTGLITSYTGAKTLYIPIKSKETYTISKVVSARFAVGTCSTTPANNVTCSQYSQNNNAKSITITSGASDTYLCVFYYLSGTDTKTEQEILDTIQIEKGSKVNHFTPYGTTPIELNKIGDYQDYFTKNSGKNLFDKDNVIKVENKILNDSGVEVSDVGGAYTKMYMPVKPNTTYTTSGMPKGGTNRVYFFDSSKTFIERTSGYTNLSSFSFTTPANCYFIDVQYYMVDNNFNTWQIEERSSASIYEPYGTGQWCKYNAIGKYTFVGTELWTQNTSGDGLQLYLSASNLSTLGIPELRKTDNNTLSVMSNMFKADIFNNRSSVNNIIYSGNNDGAIRVYSTNFESYTDYKTYLTTHNLTAYFQLATPYLTLIEDTTLINQLDNIQNAMSYLGQTNVSQVNDDKPFIIDAKALEQGSDEVVVNNIGNATSKPLIALEGTGNINIYLDGTQVLQANVEDKMNIDIDKLEAYNPDTSALLNRQVTGNYNSMTLPSGNSTIKIDGNLTSATITNYTRWL